MSNKTENISIECFLDFIEYEKNFNCLEIFADQPLFTEFLQHRVNAKAFSKKFDKHILKSKDLDAANVIILNFIETSEEINIRVLKQLIDKLYKKPSLKLIAIFPNKYNVLSYEYLKNTGLSFFNIKKIFSAANVENFYQGFFEINNPTQIRPIKARNPNYYPYVYQKKFKTLKRLKKNFLALQEILLFRYLNMHHFSPFFLVVLDSNVNTH